MKKYIILFVSLGAVLLVALNSSRLVQLFLPQVSTVSASVAEYCETVNTKGAISYKEQFDITNKMPLVIERSFVKAGDFVTVGQTVARIDKKATETLITGLAKYAIQAGGTENISSALSLIPDEITAEKAGTVVSACADGDTVQSDTAIATLATNGSLVLRGAVSENDINKIMIGQTVEISGSAFAETQYSGMVTEIAPAARKQYNGTVLETVVDITVEIDDPSGLRSGYTASGEILTQIPKNIYILPYTAISQDEQGEFVYVYAGGKAEKRYIQTGAELSGGAQILSGVSPSEKVVLYPEKLDKAGPVIDSEEISE